MCGGSASNSCFRESDALFWLWWALHAHGAETYEQPHPQNPHIIKKKKKSWLGMVIYAFNLSTQEAELGRSLALERPASSRQESPESKVFYGLVYF